MFVYLDSFSYRGRLRIHKSYFHDNQKNISNLDGGIQCCRGFHSSFRVTQRGLSLNVGKFLSENALKFMLD
jgi:hypothetical protein